MYKHEPKAEMNTRINNANVMQVPCRAVSQYRIARVVRSNLVNACLTAMYVQIRCIWCSTREHVHTQNITSININAHARTRARAHTHTHTHIHTDVHYLSRRCVTAETTDRCFQVQADMDAWKMAKHAMIDTQNTCIHT
jgi:hypothetical protein